MLISCIIKPPAYTSRYEILQCLLQFPISVISTKEITYDAHLVDILYDHMDIQARVHIMERYEGQVGVALCVDVPSIAACMAVIGTESDPRACTPNTIRAKYGQLTEPERIGEWLWWENALHRPVDERERVRDLSYVFPEYVESAG